MKDLLDVQEKLQETAAAIARLSGEVARVPDDVMSAWTLESLVRREEKLREELHSIAAVKGLEVCSYRLIPDAPRVKLAGLVSVLWNFQSLVTVAYDALKRGAKSVAKVSAESAEETALDFSYAFAGSVGFVFTVPAELTLFDDSPLDESVRLIDELAKTQMPSELLNHAKRLGPAPIRVLYRWAESHARFGISADIEWRRGDEVRQKTMVQLPEFRRLQEVISQMSDEETQEVTLTGTLVGADASAKTFHISLDMGADIKGSAGNVIAESRSVEIPRRYQFRLRKTTQVLFSTEEEKVSYELLALESPGAGYGGPSSALVHRRE